MNTPADTPSVADRKIQLRAVMKVRRAATAPIARAEAAQRIAALDPVSLMLRQLEPPVVSAFRSFGDELDTAPLLERLARDGLRLALPVMQGKGRPLIFRAWSPGDRMQAVQWGIEEPLATALEVEPDVLLVPLLAFDRTGHRLGYGGGYYDRTLRALRARRPVCAVGLGFDEQEVDAVPHLDYDERLDWILTPSGPIRCQP